MVQRTPYNEQPITVVLKAVQQKAYRHVHCSECGMPYADITDKILTMFDGNTIISTYEPNRIGLIEVHCPRHTCKQYYRMEFAT